MNRRLNKDKNNDDQGKVYVFELQWLNSPMFFKEGVIFADTNSSGPETSTDTYVIICVTSFIPLVLSLAVTLVLYRKFLFLIDETMSHSSGGLQLGSNSNRL